MTAPEPSAPSAKPYPGFAQALLVLLLFFLFGALTTLPAGVLGALKLHRCASWATLLGELGATYLTMRVCRRLGAKDWTAFFRGQPVAGPVWPLLLPATAGLMLVCNGLEAWMAQALPPPPWFERFFEDVGWPSIVLGAPLSEELLFRGLILGGFLQRYGPSKGILYSTLLFALIHMNPWQLPIALLAGLFLGWLTVRTGSLWPAVFAHFLNNLSDPLIRLFRIPHLSESSPQPSWMWATGFLLFGSGLAALKRATAEHQGLLWTQDLPE